MARRRQLGAALRTYRLETGMSVRDAADRLMCSPAKISRIETAGRNISPRDVRDLCDLYQVDQGSRDELMRLARGSHETAWWQNFGLDPALEKFVGLEGSAVQIRDYQIGTVPGLLQTREYATAILSVWLGDDLAAVKKAVDVRMMRREAVADNAELHFIMDESVVRRVVGSPQIMVGQVARMMDECESSPNVRLQLVPYGAGATKGLISGFIALRFAATTTADGPVPAMSDMIYSEGISKEGFYVEKDEDVRRYIKAFDELAAAAMSETETLSTLRSVHRTLSGSVLL